MVNDKKFVYFLLCCGSITISFSTTAITALIPAISADLRLPDFEVSRIISYYLVPYGFGALIYAPLTRYFSYKVIMGTATLLFAAASFFCATIHGLPEFLVGRVLMGVAGASNIPLGLILIGRLFEKDVRGRRLGFYFSTSFFAALAGIVLSGVIPWRWQFYIPAALGLLTALGTFALRSEAIDKVHGERVDYGKVFLDPFLRNVFILIAILSFLYNSVHKWLGIYFSREYGLDQVAISFMFMALLVGAAIGQIVGGHMTDRQGRYASCMTGLVLLALTTMALYFHYPVTLLALVLAFNVVAWTIGHNGISTFLTDLPDGQRPEIASLNSSVRFVSAGIGFSASNAFVQKSFSLTFLGIGVLMLLTIFFLRKVIPAE